MGRKCFASFVALGGRGATEATFTLEQYIRESLYQ